jgi:hypothetical protein
MITVYVLLSGKLKLDGYGREKPENRDGTFSLSLPEESTVQKAIRGMGVPSREVAMTMLNGRNCERGTRLKTNDRVILIPSDVAALWRHLGAMNLNIALGTDTLVPTHQRPEAVSINLIHG